MKGKVGKREREREARRRKGGWEGAQGQRREWGMVFNKAMLITYLLQPLDSTEDVLV